MDLAVVNNWWIDYYENASTNPFSGRAGWKTLLAGDFSKLEFWPTRVVEAADQTHFDSSGNGFPGAAAIDAEWKRLSKATANLAREAAARNDPQMLVTVLGTSLHQVQDFYTHSNFLEGAGIGTGPGWRGRGYGTSPLWSDVPDEIKLKEQIYSGTDPHTGRGPRQLEDRRQRQPRRRARTRTGPAGRCSTRRSSPRTCRPASGCAASASWVGNDAFWARAQAFRAPSRRELDNDVTASLAISRDSGHWQGHGEPFLGDAPGPGGSIEDLADVDALVPPRRRLHPLSPHVRGHDRQARVQAGGGARLRRSRRWPASPTCAAASRSPSSRSAGSHEKGAGDNWPDRGDFYVKANIAGQPYISGTIFGRDTFSFGRPHGPHTFIKARAQPGASIDEPVTSMQVRVKTGDVRFAGTDDDVYLRISPSRRFALDKWLYNDFERGDHDTYSVPIDDASDAQRRATSARPDREVASDGVAGGWQAARRQARRQRAHASTRATRIDRWLEDSKRTFGAGLRPGGPRGSTRCRCTLDAVGRGLVRLRRRRPRRHQPRRRTSRRDGGLESRPAER